MGLGEKNIHHLKLTPQGVIDIEDLKSQIHQLKESKVCIIAVVGIAGSTETGSIDPLDKMASIAKQENIYFHVDAAFGGPVIFSRQYSNY